ncbi:MAG: cytochrome P450 [Pseudomonadales bacterium]
MNQADTQVIGANGVAIPEATHGAAGHRTYEVYQRERVGESTEKIKPIQLVSQDFARDPYPLLAVLRENYPCYRDWLSNCFWITRYNDVTSLYTDDANFETRPKRWFYGIPEYGRDLRQALPVLEAQARGIDANAEALARDAVADFAARGEANLATEFAARFALELLVRVLDIPAADAATFTERYWRMQNGAYWDPRSEQAGLAAIRELTEYFRPLLAERRQAPGDDLVSAVATLDLADGPATAEDLVITLLEMDHETLHGALANLWLLLLTHADEFAKVREEPWLLKVAVLETLRHSTPVLTARRFARHEVERFGRLLPEGALMLCSAAAANRDPRVFHDPDRFIADRRDICHREARGQYRADGLATGITVGLGPPSKHPAVPEDRPRSLYAITRDTLVTASRVLLESTADLRIAPGAAPVLTCRRIGEMHTCWDLPVTFKTR